MRHLLKITVSLFLSAHSWAQLTPIAFWKSGTKPQLYTTYDSSTLSTPTSTLASTSIAVTAGQPVIVMWTANNTYTDTTIITDTKGLTWTLLGSITFTSTPYNDIYVWYALPATAGNTTITVSIGSDNQVQSMRTIVYRQGAGSPTQFISNKGQATSFSKSITPTTSGSSLWMLIDDWSGVSPYPYTAGTNCTLEGTVAEGASGYNMGILRPTINPRTSNAAFTFSFTAASGANTSWVAFEVPAH